MKRPFSDKRPLGPFAQSSSKEVMGVSGTPMPDRSKNNQVLIYRLEGDHIAFIKDFAKAVKQDIDGRHLFESSRVTYKKSGVSSKANFDEQAIIVRVRADEVPFTDEQIHVVEDTITRVAQNENINVSVSHIYIEQE